MDLKLTRKCLNDYCHDEAHTSGNMETLFELLKKVKFPDKQKKTIVLISVLEEYAKARKTLATMVSIRFYELRNLLDELIDKEIENES